MFCAIAHATTLDLVMGNISFSLKDCVSPCIIINGPEKKKLFIAKSSVFSQLILRVLGPRSFLIVIPFSGAAAAKGY